MLTWALCWLFSRANKAENIGFILIVAMALDAAILITVAIQVGGK